LPRITYDSGKDRKKFFDIFRRRLDLATGALEIKDKALKQRGKGLLPFLMQNINGDYYFRLENCSRIINLAGLREAVEAFYEMGSSEDEKTALVEEITRNAEAFTQRTSRKRGKRLSITMLPDFKASERLVHMDIEKYGIGKVRFSGTREKPFYSTVNKLIFQDGKISSEYGFRQKMSELHCESLSIVELGELEHKADELMSVTKQLFEDYHVELLTYNRILTYCANCRRSWLGALHKCPSCSSVTTLTVFDRYALG
jgi:ribonucleoside-triphosphate reductase